MAFTYTFLDVMVVSDWKKKIGGSTDLAKKNSRIGGFAYPYSPPSKHISVTSRLSYEIYFQISINDKTVEQFTNETAVINKTSYV